MVSLQVVLLSAPTSLASIMAIAGPHHAAVTHVGGSSEAVSQREHMVQLGIHRKCWSEFLCLDDYPAPPRQVGGRAPQDALGRHTPRRPPPAAPWQELNLPKLSLTTHVGSRSHMCHAFISRLVSG
jgi:hypothetical protein